MTATRTIDKGHHRHVPQIRARGTKPWDWHRSVPNYSLASNPLIKKMRPDLNLAPTEGDRSPRKKKYLTLFVDCIEPEIFKSPSLALQAEVQGYTAEVSEGEISLNITRTLPV